MSDLSDFQRLVYEPETKALRSRVGELRTALLDIATFIEGRHKEGDTEYQVSLIARRAVRGAQSQEERP